MNRTQTIIMYMIFIIAFISIDLVRSIISKSIIGYNEAQELRDENKRLQYFEDVINKYDIAISYKGCKHVIETLGLNKEEVGNGIDS